MSTCAEFRAEPFTPHPLFRNTHVQTILPTMLRRDNSLSYRRVRLDTPDGDFLDVDFPQIRGMPTAGDAPLILLLHGLEGNARKGYAASFYQLAAQRGFRSVGMNYRSCSGEMNRTQRFYHMGATGDVDFVFRWLEEKFPTAPKYLIGFSLGGNMTLKFLGENSEALQGRVQAAAAISPPFVATGKQAINYGIGSIYGHYLLKSLQEKVRQKYQLLNDGSADPYRALKATTLEEFDNAITAPLHGFADAQDYYNRCNSVRFLADIAVPTLLIRAQDDPFFNYDIPQEIIADNPNLVGTFPKHGGHVGFMEGTPWKMCDWSQRQTLDFFAEVSL